MVLLLLTSACRSDNAIGLPDELYHRWQLVQIQEMNKAPETTAKAIFITIRADSKIQYDETGYDGACCVPRRFNRNGQTLLLDFSTDQPAYCQYVDLFCTSVYSSGPEWIIKQLDGQKLVLQAGNKLLIHERAD